MISILQCIFHLFLFLLGRNASSTEFIFTILFWNSKIDLNYDFYLDHRSCQTPVQVFKTNSEFLVLLIAARVPSCSSSSMFVFQDWYLLGEVYLVAIKNNFPTLFFMLGGFWMNPAKLTICIVVVSSRNNKKKKINELFLSPTYSPSGRMTQIHLCTHTFTHK